MNIFENTTKRTKILIIALLSAIAVAILGFGIYLSAEDREPDYTTAKAAVVYVTKSGECYHIKNCKTISGREIKTLSLTTAQKNYRACKVCKPPTTN